VILLACLFISLKIENEEIAETKRYNNLYIIADEFRQSSDDLTRMVRMYVLTGQKKYLDRYNETLSIREGLSPTPIDYYEVYWDLVLDDDKRPRPFGATMSTAKKIEQADMSRKEKDLLLKALAESKQLADTQEREAIHAMQGEFKNAAGEYAIKAAPNPELAKKLVTNDSYMISKAGSMGHLQDFYHQLDLQMKFQMEHLGKKHKSVIFASIALLVSIACGMAFFLHKALKSLTKAAESNEHLLLSALPPAISDRLKHGDESSVNECEACVLFLDVGVDSEHKGSESAVLQGLYEELDALANAFKVERIRTLQGNYMVASGISGSSENYIEDLADFALAAKEKVRKCGETHGLCLYIKAGMASGTVIAGVLDQKKYIYDLWGDVLKVASALETNGVKGEIQITKKMGSHLKNAFKIVDKIGEAKVCFLQRRITSH
jgi:class 3 adenylate cyclase